MSTTIHPAPEIPGDFEPGGAVLLRGMDSNGYEAMLREIVERHIRVTYDAGTMEVRLPSQRHQQVAQLFGLFVPRLAEELEIPHVPLWMTTWREPAAEKGLEADQCYCIENEAIVGRSDPIDFETDPPPDLAIEVDITSSSLNRMGIYAALRVPKVWRHDGRSLTIYRLRPAGSMRDVSRASASQGSGLRT